MALHRHGLVQAAVLGIDPLETEALPGVQPVVVGLLQIGHARVVVLVVPVRRIGRPVACGREDLGHQQAVAPVLRLHRDVVDVARVGAPPARGQGDPLRPDPPHRMTAVAGAEQTASVHVVTGRRPVRCRSARRPMRRGRSNTSIRSPRTPMIHAAARCAPCPRPARGSPRCRRSPRPPGLAGRQPVEAEPDIPPACPFGRDVVDLAGAATGLRNRRRHSRSSWEISSGGPGGRQSPGSPVESRFARHRLQRPQAHRLVLDRVAHGRHPAPPRSPASPDSRARRRSAAPAGNPPRPRHRRAR
jgi:hypothetical protein